MSAFIFTSFATHSEAGYFYKFCSFSKGVDYWCNNPGSSGSDGLTSFTNTMGDKVRASDAYKVYFNQTKWTPKVSYGEPIYMYYTLYDNKNGTYYRVDSNYGKKLNGIAYTTVGLSRTVSYYPAAGQKPTTNLSIKSGDAFDCASKPIYCNTYTHASEFTIN